MDFQNINRKKSEKSSEVTGQWKLHSSNLIQSHSDETKPKHLGSIKMDLFQKWLKEDTSYTIWMYDTHRRRNRFLFFQAQFSLNKGYTAVFFYKIQFVNLLYQLILHFTDAWGRQLQTQMWVRSHVQNGREVGESRFNLIGWMLGVRKSDKLCLFSAEPISSALSTYEI